MEQNFRMINIGDKEVTGRRAIATGRISLSPVTIDMIRQGHSPKGNILAIAEVAGIMATKNTANVLPLCHPLLLDSARIWFEVLDGEVIASCEVTCHAQTGVEMEALVGVNACLLTIYDLAKAVDPVIEISHVYLERKEGGKSGLWEHPKKSPVRRPSEASLKGHFENLRFAVGTLSDRASQGEYPDRSGELLKHYFLERMATEVFYKIIPDDSNALKSLVDNAVERQVEVLLLTGGTGISQRDITPEVIRSLASKELTGFGELQRQFGSRFTQASWLSRSSAFVVQNILVVLFPGGPKAVQQGLEGIGNLIPHAVRMMKGESH